MKRSLLIAIFALCAAGILCAGETPRLEVKNKSSFSMQSNTRNPFWPIGWKPVIKDPLPNQADAEIPASAFLLSSIAMQSGGRFAIINGKIMQEGQEFGLKLGNQIYRVTLAMIQDGRVILTQRGQQIIVPLTRK
ncbi:MAG TPA: hypothetical protein VGK72_13705 [Chthoniobacterales bacterium]